MNVDPELYDRTNQLQRRDAEVLLNRIKIDQNKGILKDPLDVVIEAGCGTGNITKDACLHIRYNHMISFDLSSEMIDYANTFNKSNTIEYKRADLSSDWDNLFSDLKQESTADLVFSIHCLHWIGEPLHNKAIANIRSILKPGGWAYLVFFSWSDLLPLQEQLTLHPKWRHYFQKTDRSDSSSCLEVTKDANDRRKRRSSAPFPTFEAPPAEERARVWKQRLRDLVFVDFDVNLENVTFEYKDWPAFQETLKSICHLLPYIPSSEKASFLEDYYSHVKNTYVARKQQDSGRSPDGFVNSPINFDYEIISIQAKKPV